MVPDAVPLISVGLVTETTGVLVSTVTDALPVPPDAFPDVSHMSLMFAALLILVTLSVPVALAGTVPLK